MKYSILYCSWLIALCILWSANTLPLEPEFDSELFESDNKKVAKRELFTILAIFFGSQIAITSGLLANHYGQRDGILKAREEAKKM
ncbi:hypothetical protein HMI54_000980 [Coelomomyces lativittatus]|nr:hypothetical protein HMI56_003083 [Coelomomyces lativittatus]KAJ1511197.1 hypothetical protein HMI54_000980 [Coelomomyces lativittatus]KAJ1512248.1 hypothetical protein HMI55_006303 [Coelomomyces lativittatus]